MTYFNHINFLGYVNPYPYILFILVFPFTGNKGLLIFLGFLLGLFIYSTVHALTAEEQVVSDKLADELGDFFTRHADVPHQNVVHNTVQIILIWEIVYTNQPFL